MKILVISTNAWAIPLKGYGGLEMIAYWQAKELAALGHDVTLQCPAGSTMPAGVRHLEVEPGISEHESMNRLKDRWVEFGRDGVIIDNSWQKWSYMVKKANVASLPTFRVIGVCHTTIESDLTSPPPVPYPCLVGISKDHAASISRHLGVTARVAFNGVDVDFYSPKKMPRSDRYAFINRISKLKGPHVAIQMAKTCWLNLDLGGDTKFTGETEYTHRVLSQCDPVQIQWHGELTREKTVEWYSSHYALLNTIQWREPFGMVPVEAMACGAPVVTFDLGSMRDIIWHGVTGFVCRDEAEMIQVLRADAVSDLDREDCRGWVEWQFSSKRMGRRYEKLCGDLMDGREW